jgi:hypothetical protein
MKVSKDLRSVLERGDPLRGESGLSEADVARMRQAVVSARFNRDPAPKFWPRAVAVAAVLLLLAVVGTIAGLRRPEGIPPAAEKAVAIPEATGDRLQLQFATPGGTRIIWTLDPEFKVGGVAP